MTQSHDKTCLDYPIKQMKEKIRFLKIIHGTLVDNRKSDCIDHTGAVKDELEQYEIALEILRENSST